MTTANIAYAVPRAFVMRRLHSLMGLWFLIFLTEHLFTNSQAALFFGGDGFGFVRSVDWLRNLPYLQVIEVVLLGIPITYHSAWGIYYMWTAKSNSHRGGGKKPEMKYGRSHAYTWQRITAVILLVGIILHVIEMRFLHYPYKYRWGDQVQYYSRLTVDPQLYATADRLDVKLYDQKAITREEEVYEKLEHKIGLVEAREHELKKEMREEGGGENYSLELDNIYQSLQKYELMQEHLRGLKSRTLGSGEVMAVSKSFGALELLSVRMTFQSVILSILYTIFVLAAVFHGFNGLWTFMITWGLILSRKSHSSAKLFCIGLMFLVSFLGLMSIWGTFFLSNG